MTKKLIIALASLSLVSSVFAQDGACENSTANNDTAPCEKESCQAEPVVENGAHQAEGKTPDCGSCPEAAK